jgi:catechol 2,3-dioxygenase-like lactoylglutathione lyase family enzyme
MKRLHVHLRTPDLDGTIAFYSKMFGAEPTTRKPDYAKWMLDDPLVNFAVTIGDPAIEHLGIEASNEEELHTAYGRLEKAGQPVLDEGETTCCYARSNKRWVSDPNGIIWETFFTRGDATHYGDQAPLDAMPATSCC